jgi:hypothetical protein
MTGERPPVPLEEDSDSFPEEQDPGKLGHYETTDYGCSSAGWYRNCDRWGGI